ncbi:DUF1631 domain-containing protein [Thiobacter aerophilum]|uniref:DUF1631 domain-containing protein n=1 Tax=Thiobacter aerophilum TaxID=3121275 RepID=A0ABV0EG43_9BURK
MEGADPNARLNALETCRNEPTAAERRLLDRGMQIALGTLSGALKAMLEKAEEEFFQLAQKSTERAMEQLHLEAMSLVRMRAEEIEKRFREHLQGGMQAALLPHKRKTGQVQPLESDQFTLVDPDDLEESIASQEIAAKIKHTCTEELAALEKRVGLLLHDPEFQRVKHPFDPAVLAEAYMAACRDTEAPLKIRLLLVTMWDKHMQDAVASTYHEINQYLIEKGVLPRIRREIRRGHTHTAEIAALAAQAAVEAVQAAQADGDVFAAMQQWFARAAQRGALPQAGGMPAGLGAVAAGLIPGGMLPSATLAHGPADIAAGGASKSASEVAATPAPAACSPVILTQLTELQHGQGAERIPVLAQAAAGAPVAVLREIREALPVDSLGPASAMTIEVVAMIFDYIFDDARVPDAVKALIGRLQIPVLKAAMIDPAFFSRKTHPTRRLLNLIGEASIGWQGTFDHDDPLYRQIERLVQTILDQFEDDLAVFENALAEFQSFLEEQERQAEALVAAATPLIVAREQRELAAEEAREAAQAAIERRARESELPEAVRAFLCETWMEVLCRARIEAGGDGPAWQEALATMDELVWSTRPKPTREDREHLIKILPSLLKRLKNGMEAAGTCEEVRDRFLSQLVKCHASAVSAGFAQESATPAPAPRETAVVLKFPKPQATPVKLEILTPADDEGQVEVEEITISGVGWAEEEAFAPTASGADGAETTTAPEIDAEIAREAVAALKPGMWVEFRHTGMEPLQARLKWISPLRGAYLFCDRQGKRGATMPREKLEAAFRIGTARLLEDVPLMDRAVDNVIETLKQAAA